MPRRRRRFKSKTLYEICFRARRGLPLVAYKTIRLLIKSAIARTQRDDKVIICHDIWNGSHCHMLVVSKDCENLKRFYEELQKRITDYIKRLLGESHLNIWEGRVMIAEIADEVAACERIVYLYTNPARDNLEDSIDRFPGYSSWEAYQGCTESLESSHLETVPWIKCPSIPKVPFRELPFEQDMRIVRLLKLRSKDEQELKRYPNAWMKCFGINESSASKINRSIIEKIRAEEIIYRQKRADIGRSVVGAGRLLREPIMKEHKPKKQGRKIFVISSSKILRIRIILEFNEFCKQCRICYEAWKIGDYSVKWPLGAFKPPLPLIVNPLPDL